jgi:hypothetical protein
VFRSVIDDSGNLGFFLLQGELDFVVVVVVVIFVGSLF